MLPISSIGTPRFLSATPPEPSQLAAQELSQKLQTAGVQHRVRVRYDAQRQPYIKVYANSNIDAQTATQQVKSLMGPSEPPSPLTYTYQNTTYTVNIENAGPPTTIPHPSQPWPKL